VIYDTNWGYGFSLVFNELGGQDLALDFFANDIGDKWSFIFLSMV